MLSCYETQGQDRQQNRQQHELPSRRNNTLHATSTHPTISPTHPTKRHGRKPCHGTKPTRPSPWPLSSQNKAATLCWGLEVPGGGEGALNRIVLCRPHPTLSLSVPLQLARSLARAQSPPPSFSLSLSVFLSLSLSLSLAAFVDVAIWRSVCWCGRTICRLYAQCMQGGRREEAERKQRGSMSEG